MQTNFFIAQAGQKDEVISFQDFLVSSFFDEFEIPVRRYNITDNTENIALFAHGGGLIQGNIDAYDYVYRKIAKILNRNVVAIDYRLSPENRYPTPLNDVLSVYLWASGIYSNVCLAGDSAGGNLCASTCIRLKEMKKNKTKIFVFNLSYYWSKFSERIFP